MFKKVISVVLVICMLVSLSACGNKKNENEGKKEWYIGASGPITGGAAIYGQNVMNAAQIAVDEINEAGGINGYPVKFRFEDDEHNNEKAVNAYNALRDWGMEILMGTVTSGPCTSIIANTKKDNIFQVTPSASSMDCIKNGNVFQICFTDPNQGIAAAQYIASDEADAKIAIIYNSTDVYSTGIYEKFIAEAKANKLDIIVTEAFTDESKTDFSVQLQKAKNEGADLVFLPIYYEEASIILQQADAMDYAPLFFGCEGLDGILTVKDFDTKLAEGLVLLTSFAADAPDDNTQNFVKKYKEKYGSVPTQFAADGYDAIYVIKAAIEKANLKPDDSNKKLCDALVKIMPELTVSGLTGENMTWSASGEVNKLPKTVVIKNGEYVAN